MAADLPPDALPAPPRVRVLTEPPHRGRVLVVAPHPDDESAGPGGALALHARLGDPIHALYVTTGVHGDPDRRDDPAGYAAERRAEARAACAVLGVAATTFWDFPDDCVVTSSDLHEVAGRLAALLGELSPDVVYYPHPGESHSDHHFVALATERARRTSGSTARFLGYEIWSPLEPDFVLDTSAVWPAKEEALRCYPSQLRHTDILGAIEGLNRYRAILLGPGGADGRRRAEAYAEAAG